MCDIGPKNLDLSRLGEKRLRALRVTQNLFGDFTNSILHTPEVESDIQLFLDSNKQLKTYPGCRPVPSLVKCGDSAS